MPSLSELLSNNREWAASIKQREPGFFDGLARLQAPRYLWIGCSDSRVPANEIVGMKPGELFVHRNVANIVVHSDLNCLSVLQYAVDVLRIDHVIVCGHYGCGGVEAAWNRTALGLIDNWLRHVQDVMERHSTYFTKSMTAAQCVDRLAEFNVLAGVANVCRTTIVQSAWSRGQTLSVHGWIYGLKDGLLRDLGLSVSREGPLAADYEKAITAISAKSAR